MVSEAFPRDPNEQIMRGCLAYIEYTQRIKWVGYRGGCAASAHNIAVGDTWAAHRASMGT